MVSDEREHGLGRGRGPGVSPPRHRRRVPWQGGLEGEGRDGWTRSFRWEARNEGDAQPGGD